MVSCIMFKAAEIDVSHPGVQSGQLSTKGGLRWLPVGAQECSLSILATTHHDAP